MADVSEVLPETLLQTVFQLRVLADEESMKHGVEKMVWRRDVMYGVYADRGGVAKVEYVPVTLSKASSP